MKRGKFSLSYTKLLSGDMGELIPIGWHEALPGDTLQHSTSALVRAAPLLSPVMHPVEVRIHHWFVPNRLLWDNWENFITGGPDGLDATVHPTITLPSVAVGSLADYLGVPITANPSVFRPFRLEPMRQSSTRITGTRTSSPSQRCPSVTVSMPPHPRLSKISPGKKIPTPRPGRGNRRAPR